MLAGILLLTGCSGSSGGDSGSLEALKERVTVVLEDVQNRIRHRMTGEDSIPEAAPGQPSVDAPVVSSVSASVSSFYYDQLSDAQKEAYDRLLAGARAAQTEISVGSVVEEDFIRAEYAMRCDHPEIFWMENVRMVLRGDRVTEVRCDVSAGVSDVVQKVETAAAEILAQTEGMSDYETMRYCYDWIIDETDYGSGLHDQDIRSVFLERESVCAGYARAFQYLCQKVGIACAYVTGQTAKGDSHAWNLVELSGSWYWVDVTWGDPVFAGSESETGNAAFARNYNYFCVTDEEMLRSHTVNPSEGVEGHVSFSFPECTDTSLNYYRLLGCWFDTYERTAVSAYITRMIQNGYYTNIVLKFASSEEAKRARADLFEGGEPYLDTVLRNALPSYRGGLMTRYASDLPAAYLCMSVEFNQE